MYMQQVRIKVFFKGIVYEELEQVFNHFLKYSMKFLLGYFNTKVGRRVFSNRQLGKRVYITIVMIIVLE
jgi:hypothetical protein